MRAKGRAVDNQPKGEANGSAKLTAAQVREIRSSGEPTQTIANRLGVTYQCVWQARTGYSWKDAA
jgi:hypothetical protein